MYPKEWKLTWKQKEKEYMEQRGIKKQPVSKQMQLKIKRILGMNITEPFMRCPAITKSGKRCKRPAGFGTYGDFYGLGDNTGHFGLGYCRHHEKYKGKERIWEHARLYMKAIRAFGEYDNSPEQFEKLKTVEAEELEKYSEIRRGIDKVVETIKEFDRIAKTAELTEYITGPLGTGKVLAPASAKTRMELACNIAKTLGVLKAAEYKMRSDEFMHVDEITTRIVKSFTTTKRLFTKLKELTINYKEGNRDPKEEIEEEYRAAMKEIWQDMRSGEKR